MGLETTGIADQSGAALYILYDGSMRQEQQWRAFADQVRARCPHQVEVLSIRDRDGDRVRQFYSFMPSQLPIVCIIRDNDELVHIWEGNANVQVDHVCAMLQQVSG